MSFENRPTPPLILIAPNVSEVMGGESIMALQIYQTLADRGLDVHQITHSRNREELSRDFPGMSVSYVEDDKIDVLLYKIPFVRYLSTPYFMWRAARMAKARLAQQPNAIVHFTSPVSPVVPQFPIPGAPVIVGPLTGNIHHPPTFREREGFGDKIRWLLLGPSQWLHRLIGSGKQTADVVLVAGGERTRKSLLMAGCRSEQFRESLCCGIPDKLRDRPPIEHRGPNFRFVHNGRLVPHKGTDLAIKAVAKARNRVELDVIGRGPFKDDLVKLANDLGVQDRVHFLDRFKDHDALYEGLRKYRGFVFPSLAEAHGIVVQEAMMIGLPVICVDWGGPSLLVTPESGIAVPPDGEEAVVAGLADAMDRLGENGEFADSIARGGRKEAIDRGYSWTDVIDFWVSIYDELGAKQGRPAVQAADPPRV
jgi:glycosyltransferase involved in cell wall biosynthesis